MQDPVLQFQITLQTDHVAILCDAVKSNARKVLCFRIANLTCVTYRPCSGEKRELRPGPSMPGSSLLEKCSVIINRITPTPTHTNTAPTHTYTTGGEGCT